MIDLHTMLRSSTWSQGGWSKSAAVYYLLFWVAAADSALQLHQADQLSQQHRTDQQPNQIHLAYGSDESITISWSTAGPTLASCVQYEGVLSGADAAPALACGRSKRFEDRGPEGYVQVWDCAGASHLLQDNRCADAHTGGASARSFTLWSSGT